MSDYYTPLERRIDTARALGDFGARLTAVEGTVAGMDSKLDLLLERKANHDGAWRLAKRTGAAFAAVATIIGGVVAFWRP